MYQRYPSPIGTNQLQSGQYIIPGYFFHNFCSFPDHVTSDHQKSLKCYPRERGWAEFKKLILIQFTNVYMFNIHLMYSEA